MAAQQRPDGTWVLPATRRPDGTWRKERVVKAGYLPQDEVESYVPAAALAAQRKGIPGLPPGAPPPTDAKEDKKPRRRAKKSSTSASEDAEDKVALEMATDAVAALGVQPVAEADPTKVVKKLEKKLREIAEIEKKLSDGNPLTPEQQEKLGKKMQITAKLNEIRSLA